MAAMEKSAGTLSSSYEEYLDSVQGKINQFKASWTELANTVLSSDFLKGAVDTGRAFIEVLDKITGSVGTLPTLIGGVAAAMSIGKGQGIFGKDGSGFSVFGKGSDLISKDRENGLSWFKSVFSSNAYGIAQSELYNVRAALDMVNDGFMSVEQAESSFLGKASEDANTLFRNFINAGKGSDALATGLHSTGVAAKAASVGMAALNMATSMLIAYGIQLAIQGVAKGIDALVNGSYNAAQNMKKLADDSRGRAENSSKELSSLNELISKYEELASSGADDADTRAKIRNIQAEINALAGDQVGQIDLVNGSLNDQLEILREISRVKAADALEDKRAAYQASKASSDNISVGQAQEGAGPFKREGLLYASAEGKEGPAIRAAIKKAGYAKNVEDGITEDALIISDSFDKAGNVITDAASKAEAVNDMMVALENAGLKDTDAYRAFAIAYKDHRDALSQTQDDMMSLIDGTVNYHLQYNESLRGMQTDTAASFEAYKSALVEAVKNDSDISRMIEDGELTAAQIDNIVVSAMASTSSMSKGYDLWKRQSKQDSIIGNLGDRQKKEVSDELKDFISGLNDQDLDIALTVSLDEDSAIETSEDLEKAIEKAKEIPDSQKSTFSDFAKSDRIKNEVDQFASDYKEIQSAIRGLQAGTTTKEALIAQHPAWAQYASDMVEGLTGAATAAKENANNALDEIGKGINAEGVADYAEFVKAYLAYNFEEEEIPIGIDLSVESGGMDTVLNAIKSSVSQLGLSSEEVEKLTNRYQSLGDAFDAESLFERTTNGIHLNTEALRELESAYEDQQRSKLQADIDAEIAKYARLTEEINRTTDAERRNELLQERSDVGKTVENLKALQSQYSALTSSYNKWKQAQSMGEEGDMYDDITSNLKNIKELYDEGLVGTNKFRAAVQLMTNEDLSNKSAAELVNIYKESYPLMERYFTDGQAGAEQFLKDINGIVVNGEEVGKQWAHLNEDGSWSLDFNAEEVAEQLGISTEMVEIMARKLKDFGADIDLTGFGSGLDAYAADVESALAEIAKKREELAQKRENKEISIGDYTAAIDELNHAEEVLKSLDGENEIQVDAEALEAANQKVADMAATIAALTREGIQVPVTLTNQYEELCALLETKERLVPVDAPLSTSGSGQKELDAFGEKAEGLNGETVSPTVTANVGSAVLSIAGVLASLYLVGKQNPNPVITADGEGATGVIQDIINGFVTVKEGANPTITVEGASALAMIGSVALSLLGLNAVPANPEITANDDDISSKIASVVVWLSNLNKEKASPTLTATDEASAVASTAGENLTNTANGDYDATVSAGTDDTLAATEQAIDAVAEKPRTATISVEAEIGPDIVDPSSLSEDQWTQYGKRVGNPYAIPMLLDNDPIVTGEGMETVQVPAELTLDEGQEGLQDEVEGLEPAEFPAEANAKGLFDDLLEQWGELEGDVGSVTLPVEAAPQPDTVKDAAEALQGEAESNPIEITTRTLLDASNRDAGTGGAFDLINIARDAGVAKQEVTAMEEAFYGLSMAMQEVNNTDPADTSAMEAASGGLANAAANFTTAYNNLAAKVGEIQTVKVNANTSDALSKIDALGRKTVTVTIYGKTVGFPTGVGSGLATGTGFATGTAYRKGMGRVKGNGEALGGELGTELIVRNGTWFTIGDDGAEFFRYKDGDIIFNASQTEELFRNGKIRSGGGRGVVYGDDSAYAEGTAFADQVALRNLVGTGTRVQGDIKFSNTPSQKSSTPKKKKSSSKSKSKKDSSTDGKDLFDWIEVAIERVERAISNLSRTASSTFKTISARLTATDSQLSEITREIELQQQGYERYMKQANSVKLKDDLKEKVQNGTIDISKYDDKTQEKIKDYQEWYEKALACSDAVAELGENLSELYQSKFDAIEKDFENQLSTIENEVDMLNNMSSMSDYTTAVKPFNDMIDAQNKALQLQEKELSGLQKAMDDIMTANSGIEEGSEAWYEMQSAVNAVKKSVQETQIEIAKLYQDRFNAIRDNFDDLSSIVDGELNLYDNMATASEFTGMDKPFKAMLELRKANIGLLQDELTDLEASLKNAVDSGKIQEGSHAWIEMRGEIQGVKEEIQNTAIEIAQMYTEAFDDIESRYSSVIDSLGKMSETLNTGLNEIEERGYLGGAAMYAELAKVAQANIEVQKKELAELEDALNSALNSGEIKKYSSAWYEMQGTIEDVKNGIQEARIEVAKYNNAIRQIEWTVFDYVQERISDITSEADFLIKLLDHSDLFDDKGQATSVGKSQLGLRAVNYDVYMTQADQYADAIKQINKEIANDPANTELIKRRNELLKLQRDSILAAEDEKDAIADLVEKGIDAELDSLRKLIDAYNESLDSAKDLYDYQKNIREQTKQIAAMQKQLAAYAGDNSEENRARVQKLNVDLGDAMEQLAETQNDQYISEQKKMLDDLYTEYEKVLNQRLDDVSVLIDDMIATTNANASEIAATLIEQSGMVGTTLSDAMYDIWNGPGGERTIVEKYGESTFGELGSVGEGLAKIKADTENAIIASTAEISNKNLEAVNAIGETLTGSRDGILNGISSFINDLGVKAGEVGNGISGSIDLVGKSVNDNVKSIISKLADISDIVRGITSNTAKATTTGQSSGASTPTASKPASTPAPSPTPAPTPAPAPAAKETKKQVKVVNGQWWLYEDAYGKKKTSSVVHSGEVYEYLGEKNNNTLIMYKGKKRYLNSKGTKKIGFAKGGFIADLQKVPYQNGDDMITINTLKKGEAVLTRPQAAQFKILAENLPKLQGIVDLSSHLNSIRGIDQMSNGNVDVGGINVTFAIDHVQDYNDFVRQLRDDKNFERMISSMTVDRLVGKSALAKKKYYS